MCDPAPQLLYYVYIPSLFIALLLGFFIFLNNKRNLSNRLYFLFSIVVSLWIYFTMMDWVSTDPNFVKLFSKLSIIGAIVPAIFLYFSYTFPDTEKIGKGKSILIFLPILPFIFLAWSKLNILSIDTSTTNCEAIKGQLYYLMPAIFSLYCIWIAIILFKKFKKSEKVVKSQIKLILFGFIISVLWITITNVIGPLINFDSLSFLGPLGVIIFMFFITSAITKYHFLNIKVILAQTLVWSLIILIGSQFFFIENNTNKILTAITLVISAIVGIMIVRSVKKEVALRESLEIANRNQESLIHFISHQLKGFFTKSKMIFSGLMEGDFGEVSQVVKETAELGLKSDNNAVAMIQDILGASNLKTGATQYNFKKMNLNELVKKISSLFTDQAAKKGLVLETEITDEVLTVGVDENQITQVFKNLIDNSIHYTPTGKVKVTLKKSADDRKVLFIVSDTGVGLSEADKQRLFTEGGKGEESLKINVNSTGYGLYIVKKIVETHSGRVWAESAGRGHGSQFYVELNLVD
jgi:signal transduction histidine kinase